MGRHKGEHWIRQLEKWIKEAPEGDVLILQLREHSNYDGASVALDTWPIEEQRPTTDQIQERVLEWTMACQADADARSTGGPISYSVWRFNEAGETVSRTRPLKFFNEDRESTLGMEGDEPPTARGHLAQLMRHNEAMLKLTLHTLGQQNSVLTDMMLRKADQDRDLELRRLELFSKLEDAMTLKNERDVRKGEAEAQIRLKENALKQLTPYVPLLLGKVLNAMGQGAGGAEGAAGGAPNSELALQLKQFFESIPVSKLEALSNVLGEDHQAAFVDLITSIEKYAPKEPE